jgi:asparagine synthase (glutamine-hydrolysing)
MCGIAGYQGQFDPASLDAMSSVIAHRGPDDSGKLTITGDMEPVGMAHRRLSIIDLTPDGKQPMTVNCPCCGCAGDTDDSRRMWIVYNGEIYNYPSLRKELASKGHRFTSRSDTEVLLHLYAEEGTDMLRRLNGIFAFALYDGRKYAEDSRIQPGDIFIARDGLGVKPLYYAETQDGLLFSSELKSLVAAKTVPPDLDLEAIHQYLAYLYAPAPRTPLKYVKKLEPGTAMIINRGRVNERWSFYDLPYGRLYTKANETEICHELNVHLKRAVERQLLSDVPVGAFLSGGLDSSAIVAMMRQLHPENPVTAYCIGFQESEKIEGSPADLPYAKKVARHLGIDLRPIVITHDIINNLEKMIYHLDEPQADPSPINVMLIAQQARQDGYKVLLSGTGGDDIFSGYRRHWALKMERMWSWLPGFLRTGVSNRLQKTDGLFPVEGWLFRQPWFRRVRKAAGGAGLSGENRLIEYFFWSSDQIRRSLYTDDMAAQLADADTAAPFRKSLSRIPNEKSSLNRMLYLEAKHFLADHNLNYTDKASMAMGVETRVPLLDTDLVSYATLIPPRFKQSLRNGKAIFKKAMAPYLPHDIIYRKKTGFGAPMKRWLHDELNDLKAEVLSDSALRKNGLFDPASVRHLMDFDRQGFVDATYTIFAIICIQLWIKIFVERTGFRNVGG